MEKFKKKLLGVKITMQNLLFEYDELKSKTATLEIDDYNYEDDEAEAVVYCSAQGGWNGDYFVMKRFEAVKFCEHPSTKSNNHVRAWAFFFTTHRRDWHEFRHKTFRADDGRFDKLLKELNIEPLYYLLGGKHE